MVSAQSTQLEALATDPAGASSLIYTWTTLGTPPAAVSFSTNSSSTAGTTTAIFHAAGTYTLQVTVTDPSQLSATSSVTVTVGQSLTSIAVTPAKITLAPQASETFTAEALDQFGNPLSRQPSFIWSRTGKGKLTAAGHYKAPATPGTATVQARVGNIAGTAHVIIAVPRRKYVVARITGNRSHQGHTSPARITVENTTPRPLIDWNLELQLATSISHSARSTHGLSRSGRVDVS